VPSTPGVAEEATSSEENTKTAANRERGRMELETPDFDGLERDVLTNSR